MESKNDNTPSKILFDQKKAEKARGVERGGSGRASAGSVVMGDGAPIPGGVTVGTACLSSGHGPLGVPHAIGAGAHAATAPASPSPHDSRRGVTSQTSSPSIRLSRSQLLSPGNLYGLVTSVPAACLVPLNPFSVLGQGDLSKTHVRHASSVSGNHHGPRSRVVQTPPDGISRWTRHARPHDRCSKRPPLAARDDLKQNSLK